jgi:anti-sigma factor RsiW
VRHPIDDLTALLDGALPAARAAEVSVHLESCAACRAERERLASAIAALGALPPAPGPSPFFATRLEARLARERAEARRSWLDRLRWKITAPAAAAALAAGAAVFAIRVQREEAAVAAHLDLLADYEVVASLGDVESADDAAVVAALDELLGKEGRP